MGNGGQAVWGELGEILDTYDIPLKMKLVFWSKGIGNSYTLTQASLEFRNAHEHIKCS